MLTDEEDFLQGELYTDQHLTFDAAGQLQLRREHYRTGGHGYMRAYRETAFEWSPTGMTGVTTGDWNARSTYVLDGADLAERTVETQITGGASTRYVRYVRDGARRVVERIRTPATSGEDQCTYRYDDAGHVLEATCELTTYRYRWEGDRLVHREFTSRSSRNVSDWRWDAEGRLVQSSSGYDSGSGLRTSHRFYQYDAAGSLLSIEQASDDAPTPRAVATFTYDANGRLAREVRGDSERSWERDEQGRPVSFTDGRYRGRIAYDVSPGQVRVTETTESGEGATAHTSRRTWRYACFATPPRTEPIEPELDPRVSEPTAQVGHFPVAERQ